MADGPRGFYATAFARSPFGTPVIASLALAVVATCAFFACAHRREAPVTVPPPQPVGATPAVEWQREPPGAREEVQVGYASWYGKAFSGRKTASGERFDPSKMTAAHLTLGFGTWVEVTRVDTGASVRVRITDRGPFGHRERIIDLSRAAALKIGLLKSGLTKVEVRVVPGP